MKVTILKSTNPLDVAHMWYAEHIGESFKVENDPVFEDMYLTVEPIHKEHRGNIYKSDCFVVEPLPQAIDSTE